MPFPVAKYFHGVIIQARLWGLKENGRAAGIGTAPSACGSALTANGETIRSKDQARIEVDELLTLEAKQDSELILIDVPSCKGWGYSRDTLKGKKSG